jgi:hypothetical protein
VVQRLKAAQVPSSHLLTVTRGVVRAHMLLVQAVRRFRRRRQGVTCRPEIAVLTRRVLFRAFGCSRVCTNGNRTSANTRNRDSIGNSCTGSAGVPPIAARSPPVPSETPSPARRTIVRPSPIRVTEAVFRELPDAVKGVLWSGLHSPTGSPSAVRLAHGQAAMLAAARPLPDTS